MTSECAGLIFLAAAVIACYALVFGDTWTAKARARRALERRGYCSKHFKRADIHKTDPEHHGWFSVLCEDCIPEWEENERKRLEYLLKVAR